MHISSRHCPFGKIFFLSQSKVVICPFDYYAFTFLHLSRPILNHGNVEVVQEFNCIDRKIGFKVIEHHLSTC